jgi:ABC-type dipeptide/oligopeptide/nickel transport system permease component
MLRGVALRLLQAIPVVVIFAVLVFTLLHLLPGDPAVAIAGTPVSNRSGSGAGSSGAW